MGHRKDPRIRLNPRRNSLVRGGRAIEDMSPIRASGRRSRDAHAFPHFDQQDYAGCDSAVALGPATSERTGRTGANKPGLLTLTIKDKSALYLAYMPFVKNGGLFIPTNSNYRLGDEVFMLLNLMGEDEKLPVAGRVIWLTPKGAQGKRTAGIGVQFSDQDRGQTQKKIETYLAGALAGDKATHTM